VVRVAFSDQTRAEGVDFADAVFLGHQVLLKLVKLALEDFHVLEIMSELVRIDDRFL
jgi:hypothetical protein